MCELDRLDDNLSVPLEIGGKYMISISKINQSQNIQAIYPKRQPHIVLRTSLKQLENRHCYRHAISNNNQ